MTIMERCISLMAPVTTIVDRCRAILKERERRGYEFDRWCVDYDFEGKCQYCSGPGTEYDGDPVANMACDGCKVRWKHYPEYWAEIKGDKNDKE